MNSSATESGKGEFVLNVLHTLLDHRDPHYSYKLKETLSFGGSILGLNFPQPYAAPHVSAQAIEQEVKYLFGWSTALEIPYSSCDESETATTVVPTFAFATAPTLIPASPQFRAYEHWKYVQIYAADYVDEALRNKADEEKIRQELTYLQAMLEGKETRPLSDLEPLAMVELSYLVEVVKDLRTALVNAIPDYVAKSALFLEETRRWWEGLLWVYDKDMTEDTYILQRRTSSGAFVVFELLTLLEGVEISAEIRRSEYFIRYREATAAVIGLTNDLWSVGKEISDDEKRNLILVKMEQKKLSFDVAFEETRRLVNQSTGEVRRLSKQLLNDFPGNEGVRNYVRLVNLHIDGQQMYFVRVIRYGRFSQRYESLSEEDYWSIVSKSN